MRSTTEDESLPAGRDGRRRQFVHPDVGDRPHDFGDYGIPAVLEACIHDPTTIVSRNVVGQHLGHRVPVAGREALQQALDTCGLPRFPAVGRAGAELFEPRERGVEVCLVEYLAAIDHFAVDRQNVDVPPLGVEALLRVPMRDMW